MGAAAPGKEAQQHYEIDRYGVWWWETKTENGSGAGFPSVIGVKGTYAVISGKGLLVPGRRYGIAVDTWTQFGGGVFAGAKSVIVGRGVPPAPAGVRVQVTNHSTAEISWSGDTDAAAGFRVWVRRLAGGLGVFGSCLGRTSLDGSMEDAEVLGHWAYSRCSPTDCKTDEKGFTQLYCEIPSRREPQISNVRLMRQLVTGLSPSVWGYEFAVSAFNGSDESPLSEWIRAPPREHPGVLDIPGEDETGVEGHGRNRVLVRGSAEAVDNIETTDSLVIELQVGVVWFGASSMGTDWGITGHN